MDFSFGLPWPAKYSVLSPVKSALLMINKGFNHNSSLIGIPEQWPGMYPHVDFNYLRTLWLGLITINRLFA